MTVNILLITLPSKFVHKKKKMYDSLKRFEIKFAHLKKFGLRVNGLAMTDPKKKTHVIQVSRPLIFDNRLLPKRFEGLDVKSKIQGDLPQEFTINREQADWHKREYIWAPERFVKFVERCPEEIKGKLQNPTMNKKDMLAALCFGNFEEHKQKTEKLIKEGKIPAYKSSNTRQTVK